MDNLGKEKVTATVSSEQHIDRILAPQI